MITMKENKQEICDKLLEALRATSAAGAIENNDLVELRYIKEENGDEIVRPIFRDGAGKPHSKYGGYYDVNVTGDSGIAVIMDVVKQFVCHMW